jgi:hypothetical protein
MPEDSTDNAIIRHMRGMGEADLSILRAALNQPVNPHPVKSGGFGRKKDDIILATQVGSPNDLLWRMFESRGWVAEETFAGDFGHQWAEMGSVAFKLLPSGRDPIRSLIEQRDDSLRKVGRMMEIHREKCLPFVADLITSVRSAGGGNADVATLISFTLEAVVRLISEPEHHEAVVDDLARVARQRIAEKKQAQD